MAAILSIHGGISRLLYSLNILIVIVTLDYNVSLPTMMVGIYTWIS